MFYSTQILARKGPLGIVWLAAHMDKDLKRTQVHAPGAHLAHALTLPRTLAARPLRPRNAAWHRSANPDLWRCRHPLRRAIQVSDTSIPGTVDVLLSPEAPLALRLSGQLLLGVVRIHAAKVAYLLKASRTEWEGARVPAPGQVGKCTARTECWGVRAWARWAARVGPSGGNMGFRTCLCTPLAEVACSLRPCPGRHTATDAVAHTAREP